MGYVERCLWEYRENQGALILMREELSELKSIHGQNYSPHSTNGVSDPVSDVAHRVIVLERKIQQIEKRIKPVSRLKEALMGSEMRVHHMREILRLRYFEHESSETVIREMGISEATYFRRCGELKRLARKYICDWI